MTKKTVLFLLLLSPIYNLRAQEQFSFFNLGDYVTQSQNVSAVYLPKNSFTLAIPTNAGLNLSAGFKINELLVENTQTGKLFLDFDNLLNKANIETPINIDVNTTALSMTFKTRRGSISLFANTKVKGDWQYSQDFLKVAANGIAESFQLKNDKLKITAYHEIGVGVTRKLLQDKLAIGLRLKYLNGILHASTANDASLKIDVDSNNLIWTVNSSNASLNTSGKKIIDQKEINNPFTGNIGFGLDFGVQYKISENWNLELAVNDIGSINWKEDITNYNVQDLKDGVFDGVDLDNSNDITEEIENTLNDLIGTNETSTNFKSDLTIKSYLATTYQSSKKNSFRAILFNNHAFGDFKPAYSLGYNRTLEKTTFGILASSGGYDNNLKIGGNFIVKLGPIQLYAATDNLLEIFKKPEEMSNSSVHVGLNLVFGYHK